MSVGNKKVSISLKEALFVLCIILFAGIIRIPSLTQPIGPDQGIMSVIGKGLLNGELPYRDNWEMASPAIFFTYALMFKTFGLSMAAIPVTDTLVSMLTTLLVFMLGRTVWDNKVGGVSALLYAFFSNGIRIGMHSAGDTAFGTFWYIAQRESFMVPLIAGSFYLIYKSGNGSRNPLKLILAGLLSGLAFVYKFPALLFFMCIILYVNVSFLFNKERKTVKQLAGDNLSLISGFILAIVPFVLFFASKGALKDMTDVIFKYVSSVYGQVEHDYLVMARIGFEHTVFLAKENFVIWLLCFASSIYILLNDRKKENLLIVLWAAASLLYVISHREFFGYHYLIIFPSFSILSGYGIAKIFGQDFNLRGFFSGQTGKAMVGFILAANLLFFATINHMHYTKFFYYVTGKISQDEYYQFFSAYPDHDYSFPADYKVAQYIKSQTKPDDMIYSLGGIESVIYFLTDRKSPSRFIFSWIILQYAHSKVDMAAEYRKELLADLKAKTPKYIITVRSLETFKEYVDIYAFINNNYLLEKTFPDDRFVYVYRQQGVSRISS